MSGIDSYTKLMLHGDGTDGSTTITDSSLTPKTVTANGNAQIDTAQKKFGTGSILFDGTGDYLSLDDSDDWYLGSEDFTFDFWCKFNSLTGTQRFYTQLHDANNFITINTDGGKLQFFVFVSGSTYINYITTDIVLTSTEVFYHIAYVRNGSNFYVFVDGVSKTLTATVAISTKSISNFNNPIRIGKLDFYVGSEGYLNGWLDELRISKGIARWTSNFTPPTSAYFAYAADLSIGDFSPSYELELTKELYTWLTTISPEFSITSSMDLLKFVIDTITNLYLCDDSDPTKLLIHADGEEGSQVFTDATGIHTISVVGTIPQISSISKFGSGSIDFSQPVYVTGNYLEIPDSPDWDLFSGDFTIDFQIYLKTERNDDSRYVVSQQDPVDEWGWSVTVYQNVEMSEFNVVLEGYDSNWDTSIYLETENLLGITPDEFHHIEISVYDGTPKIFVDGISRTLLYSDYLVIPMSVVSAPLIVGASYGYSSDCKIDELRISKGVARHTSDFTPPTAAYSGFEITSSLELQKSYLGYFTREINDFNQTFSMDLEKSVEKILSLGSFEMTLGMSLSIYNRILGNLVLKLHLLVGSSLRLRNNLNVVNEVVNSLLLRYSITPTSSITDEMVLMNSLIGSVDSSLELLNKLTSTVTGNLSLVNKLSNKNDVEGSITLKNDIDRQRESYTGFYLSEEHLG